VSAAGGRVAPLFDPFAELAALGYGPRLIPIVPPGAALSERSTLWKRLQAGDDARGKAPGVRGRDGLWRGMDWMQHPTIADDYPRWLAMGAGCGVRCGERLIAIDADARDPLQASVLRGEIERLIGADGPMRVGRAPKALYLARCDEAVPYMRLLFGGGGAKGDRVEILSAGKQFVAAGVHPGTMRPYRWEREKRRVEDLPLVTIAGLRALLDMLRGLLPLAGKVETSGGADGAEIDQNALRGPIEEIEALLARLPNRDASFPAREDYLGVGYAAKAAAGPGCEARALEAWFAWCGKWDRPDGENRREIAESDWRRMRGPFRRGIDWLRRLVERETGASLAVEKHFEAVDDVAAATEPLFPETKNEEVELPLVSAASLAGRDIKPQSWLVREMIPAGNVTILGGDGGTGKSLLALQLAVAVAGGGEWIGMETAHGSCVFLSAEDELDELQRRTSGLRPDLEALGDLHFIPLAGFDAILAAATRRGDLVEPTALFRKLRSEVCRRRPALVVLDTSADVFGGDEIKKIHVRAFIAMLRGMALESGASVLLLQHPSMAGMALGTGTSGNVAWSNSVRSRLLLERVTIGDGEGPRREPDPDARRLVVKKGPPAASSGPPRAIQARNLVELLVSILRKIDAQGRFSSPKSRANNYGPRLAHLHPDGEGVERKQFEIALEQALAQGRVRIATIRHNYETYEKLEVVEAPSILE
jgi:hypothetical protein